MTEARRVQADRQVCLLRLRVMFLDVQYQRRSGGRMRGTSLSDLSPRTKCGKMDTLTPAGSLTKHINCYRRMADGFP